MQILIRIHHRVLDETLRMHPPVANMSPRETQPGGTFVSGYYMPAGVCNLTYDEIIDRKC